MNSSKNIDSNIESTESSIHSSDDLLNCFNEDEKEDALLKQNQYNLQPLKPNSQWNLLTEKKLFIEQYRNLLFEPRQDNEIEFLNHLLQTFKGLKYIQQCLAEPSEDYFEKNSLFLPDLTQNKQKTLFLDLDDTMISSFLKKQPNNKDNYTNFSHNFQYEIKLRPYAIEFLQIVSKYYEIYIFTASSESYAEDIVNCLDPNSELIDGIISRKHCLKTKNGLKIKDLRIIKNRNLKNMALVDNFSYSFGQQILNGIPILAWNMDQDDKELKYLAKYLLKAAKTEDIRKFNQNQLKLDQLMRTSIQTIKEITLSNSKEQ